jgi:hypothetical protein
MRRVRSFLLAWPFLSVGLFTFGLFVAVERVGEPLRPLVPVLRVLVVPLWLMRTLEMVVGIGYWPGPLQLLIALPLLFLPYVAADLLLRSARRRRVAHHRPAV